MAGGWSLGLESGPAISGQGDFTGGTVKTAPLYMGGDKVKDLFPLLILGAVAFYALRKK